METNHKRNVSQSLVKICPILLEILSFLKPPFCSQIPGTFSTVTGGAVATSQATSPPPLVASLVVSLPRWQYCSRSAVCTLLLTGLLYLPVDSSCVAKYCAQLDKQGHTCGHAAVVSVSRTAALSRKVPHSLLLRSRIRNFHCLPYHSCCYKESKKFALQACNPGLILPASGNRHELPTICHESSSGSSPSAA